MLLLNAQVGMCVLCGLPVLLTLWKMIAGKRNSQEAGPETKNPCYIRDQKLQFFWGAYGSQDSMLGYRKQEK
jgi:hypothetical protein